MTDRKTPRYPTPASVVRNETSSEIPPGHVKSYPPAPTPAGPAEVPVVPIALRTLLLDAWQAILTWPCGHPIVCADARCRAAGHDHENYGEDGWCCEHGDCECAPACKGFEPETCPATTKTRETAARLQEAAWASPEAPPSPPAVPDDVLDPTPSDLAGLAKVLATGARATDPSTEACQICGGPGGYVERDGIRIPACCVDPLSPPAESAPAGVAEASEVYRVPLGAPTATDSTPAPAAPEVDLAEIERTMRTAARSLENWPDVAQRWASAPSDLRSFWYDESIKLAIDLGAAVAAVRSLVERADAAAWLRGREEAAALADASSNSDVAIIGGRRYLPQYGERGIGKRIRALTPAGPGAADESREGA